MIIINDINDPKIEHYRNMRYTPPLHTKEKVFVAEGLKVTHKLLLSNLEIVSMFALPEYYDNYRELIDSKNIPEEMQYTCDKALMESVVGYRLHTGVMAIAKQPADCPLNELGSRIVILNGIINAENVGSIIRNCVAFGIDSMIVDNYSCSPYLRRAVRVSMGTVFSMKVTHTNNLIDTLNQLKNGRGYKLISAEITNNSTDITKVELNDKLALIFGSEGYGVFREVLEVSDDIVKIPISSDVSSLNVASSSAVIMFYFCLKTGNLDDLTNKSTNTIIESNFPVIIPASENEVPE
jgi:tRNA G18 (ribose-2'-O)-methylase SpoU